MPYRPAAILLGLLAAAAGGCTAEIEPAPSCAEPPQSVGLDIELAGLDLSKTYFLELDVHGARLLIAHTPEQRATLDETQLDDGTELLVALYDATLRLYITDADGRVRGPDTTSVTVWSAEGAMLAHEKFAPAYEDAATVDGSCDGFAVVTERVTIPFPNRL